MDFREALVGALKICGERADDPILFENALCDTVGCDLLLQPQKERFLYFNKTFHLVSEMKRNPEPRMIGTLLEKCKEQPDAPEKLCLKWIHTIFEFYYRVKHGERKDTEQILESLEADLFEPEQEGLDLPKPKPKQKKMRAQRQQSKAVFVGVKQPRYIPTPPPSPKPTLPPLPPGAVYRSLPDSAYVYLADGSPIIHVSSECPCLRPSLNQTIHKATYQRARYKDYVRVNNLQIHTTNNYALSQNHMPPVCAKCGDFTPILSYRNPKRVYKQL